MLISAQGFQGEDNGCPIIYENLCKKSIIKTAKNNKNKLVLFGGIVMGREAKMAAFGQEILDCLACVE